MALDSCAKGLRFETGQIQFEFFLTYLPNSLLLIKKNFVNVSP